MFLGYERGSSEIAFMGVLMIVIGMSEILIRHCGSISHFYSDYFNLVFIFTAHILNPGNVCPSVSGTYVLIVVRLVSNRYYNSVVTLLSQNSAPA